MGAVWLPAGWSEEGKHRKYWSWTGTCTIDRFAWIDVHRAYAYVSFP